MSQRDAVVIGSGIAGMAAAIRLSLQGFRVQVFERNAHPGGKLSLIEKDGFRFDAGPSLFTQPHHLTELFEMAGVPVDSYFRFQNVPLSCKYFFENGKRVNAWTNPEALDREMQEQLGERPGSVIRYLKESKRLYESIGTIFLNHSLHQLSTWLQRSVLKALKVVKWPYLMGTLDQWNRKAFQTDEAIQLFNRFATYNGSNPYQTPGMMSLIPHLELNEGTFYPQGGMISITNALYQLALQKGVVFHFNQPVERILHEKNTIKGVIVHGDTVRADVVVSNADVYFTYQHLLQETVKAKKIIKQERSCSGLIFYWGMNREFPDLHLHNIFFSDSYKEEFHNIFKLGTLHQDPTVYINITSKMEADQAPQGKENWFILVNAPSNQGQNWDVLRKELRARILEKLSRMLNTDVASAIETESHLDPILIESRTGSYMGSLYGTSSNSKMAAFLRHANYSSSYQGLYFCGGSVHPGGGIPLCFKSAKLVGDLVQKDFQKR
ncbi:MAG: 1-hydroxycarotenoid 3,4-desaturase CrtD [Lacibacter sp.]